MLTVKQFLNRASRVCRENREAHQGVANGTIFANGDRAAPNIASLSHQSTQLPGVDRQRALVRHFFDFAAPTYRFYHDQTVMHWLDACCRVQDGTANVPFPTAQKSAYLMILATSCLYESNVQVASSRHVNSSGPHMWDEAEAYYQEAQSLLEKERGRVTLESIQSRLSSCLFLLNTSRANQAWYNLGTVVQLCWALGIHLRRNSRHKANDLVAHESRKRTFWATYTLDVYLSLMLGRPPLLHDEDITQEEPGFLNDEDLSRGVEMEDELLEYEPTKDCCTAAAIMHHRLARILKTASREQSKHLSKLDQKDQQWKSIEFLNRQLTDWQEAMPVHLSTAIRPSSLIPLLARQHSVLQMAHAHAVMVIHRPLLLEDKIAESGSNRKGGIERCIKAAKLVLISMRDFHKRGTMLPAFWYFQVFKGLRRYSPIPLPNT